MRLQSTSTLLGLTVIGFLGTLTLSGCPTDNSQAQYDSGFQSGFADDDKYWTGYFDSWNTKNGGTILYSAASIPSPATPAYDSGYYDGLWYAYNDGYFVAYDYAFAIGFSEGYDVTFDANWQTVLAANQHVEWLDGGFTDGYNDGFSEGRVFGAYDYSNGRSFDWLDALLDYRNGTDLCIGTPQVCTGDNGPVNLYVYGTDPNTLMKSQRVTHYRTSHGTPSIRASREKLDPPPLSYRPLTQDAQNLLLETPTVALRGGYQLLLTTSWLERINQYRDAVNGGVKSSARR